MSSLFVYIASLPWHCYVAMIYRPKTSLIDPNLFGSPTFIQMKTLKSSIDAKSRSKFIFFFYLWVKPYVLSAVQYSRLQLTCLSQKHFQAQASECALTDTCLSQRHLIRPPRSIPGL